MGLNLATLAKLAKGGMSLEDMAGMLQAAGVDLSVTAVEGGTAARAEFVDLAGDATQPGAKLLTVRASMKSGERIHALLIMHV